MALIKCPECSGQVSSTAAACPHCGYNIQSYVQSVVICPECESKVSVSETTCPNCGYYLGDAQKEVAATEVATVNTGTVSTVSARAASVINKTIRTSGGYDVMLVDYMHSSFNTASNLKTILDCTYSEALKLINALPTYIYNDLSLDDAQYICRQCQNLGMRTALYSPNGNVTYYTPASYTKPLPIIVPMVRRPWFTTMPRRRAIVTPSHTPNRRPAMAHGPKPGNGSHNGPQGGPRHK